MDLVTNKPVITNAIERVIQLQNNMNIIDKCDKSLEIEEPEVSESQAGVEEEATTNGVF